MIILLIRRGSLRKVHSMKTPGCMVSGRDHYAFVVLMYLELSVTSQENLTKTDNEHHI